MPNVIISPLAEWSLKDIESFKSATLGAARAAEFVDHLLLSSVAAISEDPRRYRFNTQLLDQGVPCRERLMPDGEYRVIYEYQNQQIEILAFVSMKQDMEKLLYRYLMFR